MPFAAGNLPGRDLPPGLSSKLLATFGSGGLGGAPGAPQGAGGAGDDGEGEEEEAMTYEGLVGAFGAEERARADMGSSVLRMRGEVEDLLSRRFQAGKHGRFAVPEGVSIEEPATPTEASQFVFRKCMCGCGESRLCRADAPDCSAEPVNIQWPTLEPTRRSGAFGDIVDAASQRAVCERLTQRRRRMKAGCSGTPTSAAGDYRDGSSSASTRPLAPLRQVDVERLNALAKPREQPPPPPPEPWQPPAPPSMDARRRRRAERSASEPSLVGSSSTPSLPPLGHGSTSFFGGRVVGATGAALRPPPRRAAKVKIGEGDPPGLSTLLQASEDRFATEALFGDFSGGGGGDESPPAWKTGKVRSSASQKGYLEARLYKKPSAKPGSLQELEQRLASLRAERHQREDSSPAVAVA